LTLLHAVILGFIQGVAEFLPISSSGHLVIFQNLLGLTNGEEYVLFDILLHIGTLVSVIFFYWKDIISLISAFFGMVRDMLKGEFNLDKNAARRFVILIVVATVPLVLALLFKSKIEQIFSSVAFVGGSLILTGIILLLTDKLQNGSTDQGNTHYKNAFIVGCFQLMAILPGVSRSGSTIFGGMLVGMKKEFAVKFSLILSIVAIIGAAASSVPDIIGGNVLAVDPLTCIIAMAVSAVSGIFAIKFLVKMLNKGKFKYFAYYCFTVSAIVLIKSLVG